VKSSAKRLRFPPPAYITRDRRQESSFPSFFFFSSPPPAPVLTGIKCDLSPAPTIPTPPDRLTDGLFHFQLPTKTHQHIPLFFSDFQIRIWYALAPFFPAAPIVIAAPHPASSLSRELNPSLFLSETRRSFCPPVASPPPPSRRRPNFSFYFPSSPLPSPPPPVPKTTLFISIFFESISFPLHSFSFRTANKNKTVLPFPPWRRAPASVSFSSSLPPSIPQTTEPLFPPRDPIPPGVKNSKTKTSTFFSWNPLSFPIFFLWTFCSRKDRAFDVFLFIFTPRSDLVEPWVRGSLSLGSLLSFFLSFSSPSSLKGGWVLAAFFPPLQGFLSTAPSSFLPFLVDRRRTLPLIGSHGPIRRGAPLQGCGSLLFLFPFCIMRGKKKFGVSLVASLFVGSGIW